MDKDKLVLADGTEIMLESHQKIGELAVHAESKSAACAVWEQLTADNLRQVQIKDTGGDITGNYQDMMLDQVVGKDKDDATVELTISLRSKTTEEKLLERVAALETEQQTHTAAISDLGQAVSDIAEGGVQ